MATPSNPGWVTGYVPTATQWNAEFASKVDYPAPVSQGGTGGTTAAAGNYNLQQRVLVSATGNLALLTAYFVRTSVGAFTLYLPALSSAMRGDWIEIADVDFNAGTNNITLVASGSDAISLYPNSPSATQVLSGVPMRAMLVANVSFWTLLI